jgi:hypothetical protein
MASALGETGITGVIEIIVEDMHTNMINNTQKWMDFKTLFPVRKIPVKGAMKIIVRAHRKIAWMKRSGKIINPYRCSRCNKEGRVIAHHHAGYRGRNARKAIWLCDKCHKEEHSRIGFYFGLLVENENNSN